MFYPKVGPANAAPTGPVPPGLCLWSHGERISIFKQLWQHEEDLIYSQSYLQIFLLIRRLILSNNRCSTRSHNIFVQKRDRLKEQWTENFYSFNPKTCLDGNNNLQIFDTLLYCGVIPYFCYFDDVILFAKSSENN